MNTGAPGSSQVEYVAMESSRADDQRKYRSPKSFTETKALLASRKIIKMGSEVGVLDSFGEHARCLTLAIELFGGLFGIPPISRVGAN